MTAITDRFAIDWGSAMHRAGAAIAASGVFHLIAPFVSGFANESVPLFIVGVLYLALGEGLRRDKRWVAWIGFALMLVGTNIAWGSTYGDGPVPNWLWWLIILANLACFVNLFIALWRDHAASA